MDLMIGHCMCTPFHGGIKHPFTHHVNDSSPETAREVLIILISQMDQGGPRREGYILLVTELARARITTPVVYRLLRRMCWG